MVTSATGINLICKWEGLRLNAYKCAAGVWTIGYGHTKNVKPGDKIDKETAIEYLKEDLKSAENAVAYFDPFYNWNQNEFDALVSFAYNCGPANLYNLLKAGSRTRSQIASYMPLYNKAGGVVLKGLTNRRQEELRLFTDTTLQDSSEDQKAEYFDKYTGQSDDLDVILQAIGADKYYDMTTTSKYKRRIPIAKANDMPKYTGSAKQNTRLKILARSGSLKRPW